MDKCVVCKNEIPFDHVALHGTNGSVCMGCEFKKIDVWRVTLPGEPKNGYYDTDINHIIDILNECDYGDGYTVTKESIKATHYYGLPDFAGF